jgi:Protein of unknown function (DUF2946)
MVLCVFSLAAWMPTLSAWAVATLGPAALAEICSVQEPASLGGASIGLSDEESGDVQAKHGHCPFCLLQDHSPVLPPVHSGAMPLVFAEAALLPDLFLRSPRTLHAWSPLAARGPPAGA